MQERVGEQFRAERAGQDPDARRDLVDEVHERLHVRGLQGDSGGAGRALLRRAFLYLANWGTRELTFRVPLARAPAARVLRNYLSTRLQTAAWVRVRGSHVIAGLFSDERQSEEPMCAGLILQVPDLRERRAAGSGEVGV